MLLRKRAGLPPLHGEKETDSSRGLLLRWLGWFFLANAGLLVLVSTRYVMAAPPPAEVGPLLFSLLAFSGHYASLVLVGLLLASPLALFKSRRVVFTVGVALMVAVLLAAVIDTFVFAQYRFHLNGMVFNLLFGGAADEIFSFSVGMWMFVALAIAGLVALEWWLARMVWGWVGKTRTGSRYGYIATAALFSVFLAENLIFAWAHANSYTPITKQVRLIPGYAPLTAKEFFIERGWASSGHTSEFRKVSGNTDLAYPAQPLQCTAQEAQPNILFVVIDSWRFDAMDPQVTPNIHRLAASSWNFERHYSGGNATRTGLFSLLYGIPGTYWHAMLAEERGSAFIGELMRQNYRMGVFASAKLISPEFDRTIFADLKNLRIKSEGGTPSARDRDLTDDFLDFLETNDEQQPFFGLLFYDAPHGYDYPADYPERFTPVWDKVNYLALDNQFDPEPFLNRYKNSVHYVDSLIGEVLTELERRSELDNTVVVITGDHGQEFNDTGLNFWGHNSNFSRFQTQVPLVVHWPGKKPERIGHRTSHFDIVPTVMKEALGCANDARDYSSGQHLLTDRGSPYLLLSNYNQFAVMDERSITVVDEFNMVEVFDHAYQARPDAKPAPTHMVQVMEEMSHFLKR